MNTNTNLGSEVVGADEKRQSIWFKKLDLAFVYLFIFIFGIIIVFIMTSYLNNKVKEFPENSIASSVEDR